MSLKVFNTLSGKKEPLEPINQGKIGMYVCGVTVYDLCHVGHARVAVVFDVIFRYLKYSGYEVNYVRNFTDIDDKIIRRANEEGVEAKAIAERYIDAFYEDTDALLVERPTCEPKATDHIDEMIAHIEKLCSAGYAYEVEGDVYFSVESFAGYGKLSGRTTDELLAGARVEVDERKRNPLDFALWKASKPGEPKWPSPWGEGRPGWHIECTVMSQKYLGDTLDIHGGGKDLVFPHHENEVAQAEAATGKPFAKYWLHNGFVNVNQEKMSKSLGNFFTIRDILKLVRPEVLRLFLLSHHYRSPVDYSDAPLEDAAASLDRFYGLLNRIDEALEGKEVPAQVPAAELGPAAKTVHEAVLGLFFQFETAMNDDFNTAEALGHMHKCARQVGSFLHEEFDPLPKNLAVLKYAAESFRNLGVVLGLLGEDPQQYFAEKKNQALKKLGITAQDVEEKIAARAEARKAKDWARADALRDELADLGVIMEDGASGTKWSVK